MATQQAVPAQTDTFESGLAWSIGIAGFLLQILFAGRYGYFRDELYYIAADRDLCRYWRW